MPITSLNDLLGALKSIPEARQHPERFGLDPSDADGAEAAYCASVGLPVHLGRVDMTKLPAFGGDEPDDDDIIISWDATQLLLGTRPDNAAIMSRAEYERRAYPRYWAKYPRESFEQARPSRGWTTFRQKKARQIERAYRPGHTGEPYVQLVMETATTYRVVAEWVPGQGWTSPAVAAGFVRHLT